MDEVEKGDAVDDKLEVLYDPKDPEVARAASSLSAAPGAIPYVFLITKWSV